jgi:uncharacterized protein (TIGR02001 family)
MKFSKSKVVLALAVLASSGAFAQAKAPEPDYTLSYNVGVVTDYRYRGISQSAKNPALQGGVDFAHKNGFYLGAWGSTITWIKDSTASPNFTKGSIEIDLYGGYKGELGGGFTYDVGLLQYWYAGNTYKNLSGSNADTLEVYGAVSYGPATLKYSHSLTDLFGTLDSEGSSYLDLSATFDLGKGWTVTPHVGRQKINTSPTSFAYTDYSIALGKDLGDGWSASATVVSTNWKHKFGFAYTLPGSGTKDLGNTSLVLGIKKSF